MEKKILRAQLYTLFFVTTLNLIYFYFRDNLPDHYFEISSHNLSINFISYYFITVLANFGYWCGIWITVSFVVFSLLHSFLFTKKSDFKNQIVLATLLPLTLFLSYLFLPEAVGEGMHSLLEEKMNLLTVLVSIFILTAAFFYLVAEKKFYKFCQLLWSGLLAAVNNFKLIKFQEMKNPNLQSLTRFIKSRLVSIPSSLKQVSHSAANDGAKPKSTLLSKFNPIKNDAFETRVESELNETVKKENNKTSSDFEYLEDSLENESNQDDLEEVKSPFSTGGFQNSQDSFFESDELISCIASRNLPNINQDLDEQYFKTIARSIEEKLKEFNISAEIINVLKGPVVDTFELELGAGVKVAGVINRTDDLSLALKGSPIRMVYPMKGKTTIGIEVPRSPRNLIYLDEILSSSSFKNSSFRLPIAMGKDAYGDAAFIDLASTPHFLVAGTTGAGKSVFVNTLLVSLIIKLSPKKLRLILIDPKQLELALYQKLPHLIMPVVTDSQIASISLMWAIEEMERRYSLLKDFGVKNIEGFNKKLKIAGPELTCKIAKYYPDAETQDFEMPYIVIIVDEFADLKLSKSGPAIENSISRLAAKARASGMHIVLATQRPSADVITGVIKANFPTRVAFRVTTNMDSRVILDTMGAEKLLGKGDMLFKQGIETLRMHSAYVEEEEIEQLVDKLATLPTQYDPGAMDFMQNNGTADEDVEGITTDNEGNGLKDEKFEDAVHCVATHRMASASFLQRRLGVGYNRAANLIEEMERHGIVGPAQGSKPRKVLIPSPSDSTP